MTSGFCEALGKYCGVNMDGDGILGHQFNKRLESFAPCYLQSLASTSGFQRKPYSSLVLKILSKNPQNKKT
jgi:hypothetical protein